MSTIESETREGATGMVATVAAAFFQNNPVQISEIGAVIRGVRENLFSDGTAPEATTSAQEPKIAIEQSVKPDYIVCLEDGKKLKMLKRHLMSAFNMTPDQYRQKWNLPADYPMVAPNYASQRRDLAMASGLGRSRGAKGPSKTPAAAQAPARRTRGKAEAPPTPKRRGRPPKAQTA